MTAGRRPATTPHRCHICGAHIWRRGTYGWQHLTGGRNHPAHHHTGNNKG